MQDKESYMIYISSFNVHLMEIIVVSDFNFFSLL